MTPLPPGEQQSRDNHDQCKLQHQAEHRSKAGHAAKKSVPKQKTEKAGTEEAGGKTAEQAAAEQTRTCRLTNGAGFPRLRQGTLHGRGGVRRGLRDRRRRESTRPAAAPGEPAARASMRVGGNKQHGSDRGNRDDKAVSEHRSPPGKNGGQENMYGGVNL